MEYPVLILVGLVFVAIALSPLLKSKNSKQFKAKPLLTPNEKEFFGRLREALPKHVVLAQVSMGAILAPNMSERNRQEFFRIRGKFAQKIIDYVVLDQQFNIVCIIELDDRSHDKKKDKVRDAMLKEAGYATIRYESKEKPSTRKISSDVSSVS